MAVPNTHVRYAGGPADFTGSGSSGNPLIIVGGASLTVWESLTGARVTDLYNGSEDPVTAITTDSFGNFAFYASAVLGTVYISGDNGTNRYAVQRTDVGAFLASTAADVDAVRVVANNANATAQAALAGGGGSTAFFLAPDDAAAADAPPDSFILIRRAV